MCSQLQPGHRRLVYSRGTGQGTPGAKGLGRVSWRKHQHRAARNPRCGSVGRAGEREWVQKEGAMRSGSAGDRRTLQFTQEQS